jgi:hypothetical protein
LDINEQHLRTLLSCNNSLKSLMYPLSQSPLHLSETKTKSRPKPAAEPAKVDQKFLGRRRARLGYCEGRKRRSYRSCRSCQNLEKPLE